jgi:hypothetical protein
MTITAERQDDRDNQEQNLFIHTCFWCKKPFVPADEVNYVYLGGHGMVWGCDSCLDLKQ